MCFGGIGVFMRQDNGMHREGWGGDWQRLVIPLNFFPIPHTSSPHFSAGPPESMREHVVAATHAMKRGDWRQCKEYILSIKAWDLFIDVEPVKSLLTR